MEKDDTRVTKLWLYLIWLCLQDKKFYLKNIRLNSYFLDSFLATIQFAGTHYYLLL